MYDIIIIGAGTAGLSAAIYTTRAGKNTLVLESAFYGGQIINSHKIENYPAIKQITGVDFATALYDQAVELGAQVKFEKVNSIVNTSTNKVVNTSKNSYECKSIIIATGSKRRELNIENEKKFTGYGVSYCATCDGAFYKGRDVAIVGGGNTAITDAIFLAHYCKKVYLIHRKNTFRAEARLVENLKKHQNIVYLLESQVVELIGNDSLEQIAVMNNNTGEKQLINIDGLFIAIGHIADNSFCSDIISVDSAGYIIASEDCATNIPGIYAVGDCRTKYTRQLATAAGDGAVAGIAACEYINDKIDDL